MRQFIREMDSNIKRPIAYITLVLIALSQITWTKAYVSGLMSYSIMDGLNIGTILGILTLFIVWIISMREL